MKYRDKQGRVLYVSDGISRGEIWFTAYRKASGATKRLCVAALPIRDTRQEAQADLDRYAAERGMKDVV